MKVRTFDLLTGDEIECELVSMTEWTCLMTLLTPEGKKIVRHPSKCSFDKDELQKWFYKDFSPEAKKRYEELCDKNRKEWEEKYGKKAPW